LDGVVEAMEYRLPTPEDAEDKELRL